MMGVGRGPEFNFRPILFEAVRDIFIYSSMLLILSSLGTSCQIELGRM